jgi:hypothetical protein
VFAAAVQEVQSETILGTVVPILESRGRTDWEVVDQLRVEQSRGRSPRVAHVLSDPAALWMNQEGTQ